MKLDKSIFVSEGVNLSGRTGSISLRDLTRIDYQDYADVALAGTAGSFLDHAEMPDVDMKFVVPGEAGMAPAAQPNISVGPIVSLVKTLAERFHDEFPSQECAFDSSRCSLTIPALSQDVGDIEIVDDDGEMIVFLGKFTHVHLGQLNQSFSEAQDDDFWVNCVVVFLRDLFDDKIAMWGSHEKSGGWFYLDANDDESVEDYKNNECFLWSGPVRT